MSWAAIILILIGTLLIAIGAYREGFNAGRRYGQLESTHPGEITRPRPNR